MAQNLSFIFKEYAEDMRTLSLRSLSPTPAPMEVDPLPSAQQFPEKSPLGKGGKGAKKSPLKLENSRLSPTRSPGKIIKKTDQSPSTHLSRLSVASPGRPPFAPPRELPPCQLFSGSMTTADTERAAEAEDLSNPLTRRRHLFEKEIETYARILAQELAYQIEEKLRGPRRLPSIVGLNDSLIKMDKHVTPSKDEGFLASLVFGVKVQLLGILKGALNEDQKENLYRGKESISKAEHEKILLLEESHPLVSEEEEARLKTLETYLLKLYEVDYKGSPFNKRLSSLIADGEIWESWIHSFNQEIRESPFPIGLGALATERIS